MYKEIGSEMTSLLRAITYCCEKAGTFPDGSATSEESNYEYNTADGDSEVRGETYVLVILWNGFSVAVKVYFVECSDNDECKSCKLKSHYY